MTLTRRFLALSAASLALSAVREARAQAAPPPSSLPPIQSVAVNPLAIPFGVFSAEYEAALPVPGFTVGVGGTYWSNDGDRDAWVELKGMYYPSEVPFRGFAVGLTAGIQSARNNGCDDLFGSCGPDGRRSQTAPTIGILTSYDWLIGRAERFRVGLGLGAKRVLKDVGGRDPLWQVYPDGRFVIGVVF